MMDLKTLCINVIADNLLLLSKNKENNGKGILKG